MSKRATQDSAGVSGINDDVDADSLAVVTSNGVLQDGDEIISGAPGEVSRFRRRVVRQQEVPYMRKVKVPVFTKKVIPTTFQKRVKIQKLVQVEDFEEVDETYTVFEEEKAQREKQIWVQEEVKENYMKKVPVVKTRIVKKPVTKIEEQDDFQLVTIPGTKMIDVHGWRIDEIEEKKLIEVEEWEVYELLPHNTGKVISGATKELGRVDGSGFRKTGTQIYAEGDLYQCGIDWNGIEQDETTSTEQVSRTPLWKDADGNSSLGDTNARGYTSIYDWNAKFGEVKEGFNLTKCLAYTKRYLEQSGGDVDPAAFTEELEQRWNFVDDDSSGLVSLYELRKAVWEREEDNEGVPMPAMNKKFPKALQDVVDQIYRGCGSKNEFTFWDFVNYLLSDEESMAGVDVVEPNAPWAKVR